VAQHAERRLLSVADAALYLAVSEWTIRDWDTRGVLASARVRPPALRRVLYDRRVLDQLIESWRDG
jgi:hypothetical protein